MGIFNSTPSPPISSSRAYSQGRQAQPPQASSTYKSIPSTNYSNSFGRPIYQSSTSSYSNTSTNNQFNSSTQPPSNKIAITSHNTHTSSVPTTSSLNPTTSYPNSKPQSNKVSSQVQTTKCYTSSSNSVEHGKEEMNRKHTQKYTYNAEIKGKIGAKLINDLTRPENESFLTDYFVEVYKKVPNVVISKKTSSKDKPTNLNSKLKIYIKCEHEETLKKAVKELDSFFASLVSKIQVLQPNLPSFLEKHNYMLADFKWDYNVATAEFYNTKEKQNTTVIIGEAKDVGAAIQFLKDIKSYPKNILKDIQVPSKLLFDGLKKEIKGLVDEMVSYEELKFGIRLFGELKKVEETAQRINAFLSANKKSIHNAVISKLPDYYLASIESDTEKHKSLEDKHQTNIYYKFPDPWKSNMKIGVHYAKTKSLILVQSDILALPVDAIVNITNLDFKSDQQLRGLCRTVKEKAGDKYVQECLKHKPLVETEVIVTHSGDLRNCRSIINVSPLHEISNLGYNGYLELLKTTLRTIMRVSSYNGYKTIAIPFIPARKYCRDADTIGTFIQELVNESIKTDCQIEKIFICDLDKTKITIAEKKIENLVDETEESEDSGTSHLWQWLNESNVWTNYSRTINMKINNSYNNNEEQLKITVSRNIAYTLSFNDMVQIDDTNGVRTSIRDVKSPPNKTFKLIKKTPSSNEDHYGEILIEGTSKNRVEAAKEELNNHIKTTMAEKEILINPFLGKENIEDLEEEIRTSCLKCTGDVQPGSKIRVAGSRYLVNKLKEFYSVMEKTVGQSYVLPQYWTHTGEEFCSTLVLKQSEEGRMVADKFHRTMGGFFDKIYLKNPKHEILERLLPRKRCANKAASKCRTVC